ncbi:hypothetical protein FACS1894172_06610 [Spirochaetia bacterium]|nr:hypothetical protein FACS1894164_03810 [Spirochaetia bacterium]GHU31542.1 hypothetical protein FACS1894172_06610 [Spirochaetia bacterium]
MNGYKIILKNDNYKFQVVFGGRLFSSDIGFTDDGTAYKRFWNKYGRPPAQIYQQYIIDRRDLLVPQNIREVKGSFFTPKIWADKSKEYLASVFGADWQDEYYVWDCAAGTGNLLAGLSNEYNVWASDVEQGNVETMQSLIDIDENLNLLSGHVFQFDFLNDSFDKLPEELKKIIDDPEKRKKLIVYINPPYAEAANNKKIQGKNGKKSVEKTLVGEKYENRLSHAKKELFAQFLMRIYLEIPDCKIAEFSTLKALQAPRFSTFRSVFLARLENCFIVPADTFENVKGQFPIGFKIWDTTIKEIFIKTSVDVFDKNGNSIGQRNYYSYDGGVKFINDWAQAFRKPFDVKYSIATLIGIANDFQQQNLTFFDRPYKKVIASNHNFQVTKDNLIESAIYYTVRHAIPADWLNDRDQFLYPNDNYKSDIEFQNDCLMNILFNNNIQSKDGINHWIPFTEKEVGAREKFESNFMSDFLKGRTLSAEATAVLNAGKELWKYYHATIKNNKTVSVNASYYDIREYFQGRKENGTMNTKSTDETYNDLIKILREALKVLAKKIEPAVYKYGFLRE